MFALSLSIKVILCALLCVYLRMSSIGILWSSDSEPEFNSARNSIWRDDSTNRSRRLLLLA